jgi:hypothetical protein
LCCSAVPITNRIAETARCPPNRLDLTLHLFPSDKALVPRPMEPMPQTHQLSILIRLSAGREGKRTMISTRQRRRRQSLKMIAATTTTTRCPHPLQGVPPTCRQTSVVFQMATRTMKIRQSGMPGTQSFLRSINRYRHTPDFNTRTRTRDHLQHRSGRMRQKIHHIHFHYMTTICSRGISDRQIC